MKIKLSILEEFIRKEADRISKLDFKHLPEVLIELQVEQSLEDGIDDHKAITEISEPVIRRVFECWQWSELFEDWLDEMKEKMDPGPPFDAMKEN